MNKITYLLCLCLFSQIAFSQGDSWDDDGYTHLNYGIGLNYGAYTNNNNLQAFSYSLNVMASSGGRHLLKPINLAKYSPGVAFNFGVEARHFSFHAEWHNMILTDDLQYEYSNLGGEVFSETEGFKIKTNSFNVGAAVGFKLIKIGASVDFMRYRLFYSDLQNNHEWKKHDYGMNMGVSAFLEITPTKFIKIKPYIQIGAIKDELTVYIYNFDIKYEFAMNNFSNYGVITFIEIPQSKLKNR